MARLAASSTCAGGSKSGSPTPSEITSTPCALSSATRRNTAAVADSAMRDMRAANACAASLMTRSYVDRLPASALPLDRHDRGQHDDVGRRRGPYAEQAEMKHDAHHV